MGEASRLGAGNAAASSAPQCSSSFHAPREVGTLKRRSTASRFPAHVTTTLEQRGDSRRRIEEPRRGIPLPGP